MGTYRESDALRHILLASTDGGLTWSGTNVSGVGGTLHNYTEHDALKIILLQSGDGGGTWTPVQNPAGGGGGFTLPAGATWTNDGTNHTLALKADAGQNSIVFEVQDNLSNVLLSVNSLGVVNVPQTINVGFLVSEHFTTSVAGHGTTGVLRGAFNSTRGETGATLEGNSFVGIAGGAITLDAMNFQPDNSYLVYHQNVQPGYGWDVVCSWVDEASNTLKFRVLYGDGTTFKTGSVALV